MDLSARLEDLEAGAMCLEPGHDERHELMKRTMDAAENFLAGLETQDSKALMRDGGNETSGILNSPITDHGTSLDKLLGLFEQTVLKTGIEMAHGMTMGFVPGGGLFPSAIGDYLTAVTNKFTGIFYGAPEGVRLENMLVSWAAGLCGYPPGHAGNLTSGGSSGTLIAVATARESRNVKGKDYDKLVVYVSETTHDCIDKSARVLGMSDAIVRKIPVTEENLTMDVESLRKNIANDEEDGLKPFIIVANAGNTVSGSVDPIDQIADVAEEYNVWLHVDAAYGGFFLLVDEVKHLFKGIERSDSAILDPHKGLFLPSGSGIVVVRDGRKLHNAFSTRTAKSTSTAKDTDVLGDAGDLEFSPCELSFELTKHSRGLRMWLPLKLFGVKAFATALEEKLVLAKYFHEKITSIEGFVSKLNPQLSTVVFYYDAKDDDLTDKFNRELQENILADGRVLMSSVMFRGKYFLRICILCFRTHRKHIDLCLQIIQENTTLLKVKYM